MAEDALITGYFGALDQAMYLFDVGVMEDLFATVGQDDVPFFLSEEYLLYEGMELSPELEGQKLILHPEDLLPADPPMDWPIPDGIKEIASFATLAASFAIGEMLVPLAIAGSFAVVANIIRVTAEPDTIESQIADFLLKVNKVIFFCTSAVAIGKGLTDIMGQGPMISIVSSGIASVLNSAYNILEEYVEYDWFLPPTPGKFPTTGVDKHSCVDYETGELMAGQLIPKVINKMAGRTAKQTMKEVLSIILDEMLLNNALVGLPVSFIANLSSNVMETMLNSGLKDFEHHMERDLIGAATKTLSKEAIEKLSIEVLGGANDYVSTSVSIFLSVLSRTLYDGYWDKYLPSSIVDSPTHEHIDDPESQIEDFDNES